MALSSTDFFMLQRGGTLSRTTVGELNDKMQDSDLVILQRNSVASKATWGDRVSFQDDDLFIVGNPLSKKTTWSALNGFLTVHATIFAVNNNTSTNENVTIDDLFTVEELASPARKVITVEDGALVGGTSVDVAALSFESTNTVRGSFALINGGTIIGKGGTGSTTNGIAGGKGGPAILTDYDVVITNNGSISGGGGGGGFGGTGGNGTQTQRQYYGGGNGVSCCSEQSCAAIGMCSCSVPCSQSYGGGAFCVSGCNQDCKDYSWDDGCSNASCGQCARDVVVNTTGGTGGAGGNGEGYQQTSSGGSSGANGPGSAGNGGTGGNGGSVGTIGATGANGFNGSTSNGLIGSSGGASGEAFIRNCGNITFDVEGTINGPNIDVCKRSELLAVNNGSAINEEVTLDDMFTQEQIESGEPLELSIQAGAIVGSRTPGVPALSISSAFTINGPVIVRNQGTIIGNGGTPESINGSPALVTTVDVTVFNSGTISGGGGAGGAGGTGGTGQETRTEYGTPSVTTLQCSNEQTCAELGGCGCSSVCNFTLPGTGWSCIIGCNSNCRNYEYEDETSSMSCSAQQNSCYRSGTFDTDGGDGGNGGDGEGYLQVRTDGVGGANGATNAGNGGLGGNGGAVGTNGTPGNAGSNGSKTNGTPGNAGGIAGNATTNNGNTINMNNSGTINGNQG